MGISSVPILIGGILMIVGIPGSLSFDLSAPPPTPEEQKQEERMMYAGAALAVGGAAAMIASGILLGVRKQKLRRFPRYPIPIERMLKEARYEGPRKVQWDMAMSRLVF
jgi:hypothetical protein